MRKAIIVLTILVIGLFASMLVEVQTANAQYTQNGAGCPLVSPVNISSPSNATYGSNLLTLNINIESLFDDTIYQYVVVYCIDGQNNVTIPSSSLSFDLPNGDTGAFTIVKCVGSVALPQLDEGSHCLTVYATYVRLDNTRGNWPAVIYDSSTVSFTINDGIPPAITNLSIINGTYLQNNLTLSFTTDKPTSWMGYSLDGTENLTIAGNTTLTSLSNGSHSLVIYANDTLGNMGASAPVNFSVDVPSTTKQSTLSHSIVEVGASASTAVLAILLVAFFKKRK